MLRRKQILACLIAAPLVVAPMENTASANVLLGQDDFDANRSFSSFVVDPPIGTFTADADIFEIVSYTGAQAVERLSTIQALRQGQSPMRPEVDGNAFWVSDLDGSENPNSDDHGSITWGFDVDGFNEFQMSLDMSFFGNTENDDIVTINYAFDGASFSPLAVSTFSEGGTEYTTFVVGGDPIVNSDHDTFTLAGKTFTNNLAHALALDIPGEGSELVLQIRVDGFDSSSEQLVFDNLLITGVPEPGSLALLGLSGVAILARRRNRRHA